MRDAGHRTPDAGHRTSDGEKSKNNISTPQGGGHNTLGFHTVVKVTIKLANQKSRYIKHGLLVRQTSVNGF